MGSAECLIEHRWQQLIEMRRRLGLSGLGCAGFRLEAVEPELGVERGHRHLAGFKRLDALGPVAASSAGRGLAQCKHSFFAKEPEAEKLGSRLVGVRDAG